MSQLELFDPQVRGRTTRERRWETKGRPCGMMRIAKFKCPRMDSSSCLEQLGLAKRVDATRIDLSIFSFGREAWNFCESKLIPKNSMEVLGPAVLSWARGIPSSEKTVWVVKRCAAGMESGGEMIRKSSKRCTR